MLLMNTVTVVNAPSSGIHEFIQRPVSSDQVLTRSGVAFPSNSDIKSQQWKYYYVNNNNNVEIVPLNAFLLTWRFIFFSFCFS